jgi:hypothetical protein
MMLAETSALSLAAAALYSIVASACLFASFVALRAQQQTWHLRTWLLLAFLFLGLLIIRLLGTEEAVRDALRAALRANASYAERRNFQGPIVAIVMVLGAAWAFWWISSAAKLVRGRRNIMLKLAQLSALGMIMLVGLRLVSFHAVDRLLYGPIKLNWITDIGTSMLVLVTAICYVQIVRERA